MNLYISKVLQTPFKINLNYGKKKMNVKYHEYNALKCRREKESAAYSPVVLIGNVPSTSVLTKLRKNIRP